MTGRIRWEDEPDAGETRGYVGSLDQPVFRLWDPDAAGDRVLFAFVAGSLGNAYHGTDPDKQKDRAERLLEEFISSLGAVFPAEPAKPSRAWHADWAEVDRDQDGNAILRHKPTGGLYRVLPVEES